MKVNLIKIFFFLLFIQYANAIDLTVTKTDETCPANGSLTFSISGQASGIQVFYSIYLLPNITTPITTVTTNTYGGLNAGSYRVVASQTVGTVTSTDTVDINIANQVVPLVFSINEVKVKCGNDGEIEVVISSGNAVSYQLLTGPVTTGLQSSNVFTNLPVGQYNIRVYDNCGQAVVQTFTLTNIPPLVNILSGSPANTVLPACGFGSVIQSIDGNPLFIHQVFYPLTIQITGLPPVGAPIVTTQTIASGTTDFIFNMPLVNGSTIPYNILITDVCGNQFISNNNVVPFQFDFTNFIQLEDCNSYFVEFIPLNYLPPFTVNFISSPAGFIPSNYNANHPGPFNSSSAAIYGGPGNFLPLGNYSVQITDSCGNTKIKDFEIQNDPANIVQLTSSIGCSGVGNIGLNLSPNIDITSVIISSAPTAYSSPLPHDVSGNIDPSSGDFSISNVPIGTYVFLVTDICGNVYPPYTVILPQGLPEIPNIEQRPSCNLGEGSIKISFSNSDISSIQITEAPSNFGFPLPYDASFNVNFQGDFYMNSLPAGTYQFEIIDNCGNQSIRTVSIIGYAITSTISDVIENCGSFDLQLNHVSNAATFPPITYWLQKYNPIADVWEHPDTGFDYITNTILNATNAYQIFNNQNNLNLAFGSGLFRIVKVFFTFTNDSSNLFSCISTIDEFTYESGPQLIDVYAFPCSNNTQEVVVIAEGLPPLEYRIIEKNGLPFIVNNGTSNIFSGLENAVYKIEIEDNCGNILTSIIDVNLLTAPSITATNLCDGLSGVLEVQNIPFVTYQWFEIQNPTVILSTTNQLDLNPFNSATDSGTYVVQLSSNGSSSSCINQTLQYVIDITDYNPNAGSNTSQSYCNESQSINLNSLLTNPHDSGGVWTDNNGVVLTNTIVNPVDLTIGLNTYFYTVSGICSTSDVATINITIKELPTIPSILVNPSIICEGDDVQLTTPSIAGAIYFWTGPNGFSSSLQNPLIQNFSSLNNGTYFLFIEVDDCNSPTNQVVINSNSIPNFTISGATEICPSQTESLSVVPTNFLISDATYQWYFNGSMISGATNSNFDAVQFGIYELHVNNGGCIATEQIEIIEKVNSFDVELTQGCLGNDYFVTISNATNFPVASFQWTGPNGFTSSDQNINVTNSGIGTYSVLVTDADGCTSTSQILVERVACFIPNGLSPNDDGDNDSLNLAGYNVKKLSIYNRYGRLVYEKDDYVDEWKGQNFNGKLLPATTYFYVIDYATEGENKKMGWIYISY